MEEAQDKVQRAKGGVQDTVLREHEFSLDLVYSLLGELRDLMRGP